VLERSGNNRTFKLLLSHTVCGMNRVDGDEARQRCNWLSCPVFCGVMLWVSNFVFDGIRNDGKQMAFTPSLLSVTAVRVI
jgi:hypothetical protein